MGLASNGRHGGLRHIVGMTANILPLRLSVTGDMTVGALVRTVAAEMGGALRHRRFSREQLARELNMSDGGARLTDVVVNIMGYDFDLDFGGSPAASRVLSIGPVDDVSLFVSERAEGKGPLIGFDANPELYDPEDVRLLQQALVSFLTALARADADTPLRDLPFLDDTAAGALLNRGCGTALPAVPATSGLPEAFGARARLTPDAPAVVDGAASLSYQELAWTAGELAVALTGWGIGAEDGVGVLVGRSAAVVAATIGTAGAGAAYVPMDAAWPAERARPRRRSGRPPRPGRRRGRRCPPLGPGDGRHSAGDRHRRSRSRRRRHSAAARTAAGSDSRRSARLRDVHLRLHRPAQGRRRHPRRRDGAGGRHGLEGRRVRRRPAALGVRVRRLDVRDLGAPPERRPCGRRSPRCPRSTCPRRAGGPSRTDGAVPDDGVVQRRGRGRPRGVRGAAPRGSRRRGGHPRPDAAGGRRRARHTRPARVRAHGDHDLRHPSRGGPRRAGRAAHRPGPRRDAPVRARRRPRDGAARRRGGALRQRLRRRPRLSGPCGADRHPVRRRPVRRTRCADVPDRRPRPLDPARRHRVRRTRGRAGQTPRIPHRARRDREHPAHRPRCAGRLRPGTRGHTGRPATRRLRRAPTRSRTGRLRPGPPRETCPARLHGAVGVRPPRRTARSSAN